MCLQNATRPGCYAAAVGMGYPGITHVPRRHSNTLVTKLSIASLHSGQLRLSRAPISTARVQRLQVQRCPQGARMTALGRSRQMMQASSAGTSARGHTGTGAQSAGWTGETSIRSQHGRLFSQAHLTTGTTQHKHSCISCPPRRSPSTAGEPRELRLWFRRRPEVVDIRRLSCWRCLSRLAISSSPKASASSPGVSLLWLRTPGSAPLRRVHVGWSKGPG